MSEEKTGQLKGPYTSEDWYTMLMLKKSLTYLRDRPKTEKRSHAIRQQEKMFKDEIEKAA